MQGTDSSNICMCQLDRHAVSRNAPASECTREAVNDFVVIFGKLIQKFPPTANNWMMTGTYCMENYADVGAGKAVSIPMTDYIQALRSTPSGSWVGS
jgi:hypothetical protein